MPRRTGFRRHPVMNARQQVFEWPIRAILPSRSRRRGTKFFYVAKNEELLVKVHVLWYTRPDIPPARVTSSRRRLYSQQRGIGAVLSARPLPVSETSGRLCGQKPADHRARGTFIGFIDADDIWLPIKLKIQVKHVKQHPENEVLFCKRYHANNLSYRSQAQELLQISKSSIDRKRRFVSGAGNGNCVQTSCPR